MAFLVCVPWFRLPQYSIFRQVLCPRGAGANIRALNISAQYAMDGINLSRNILSASAIIFFSSTYSYCNYPLAQLSRLALTYHLSVTTISLKTNSSFVVYMSLIPDMNHSSSSFQSLFTAAVQDYADQTGTTLDDHPLTKLLESCDSVDSISSVLQQHARRFSEFRGDDGKIMKSLKRAVNVLYMLSTSSVLGASIGLVCVT